MPEKILCPRCGAEMNRHAVKLVDPTDGDAEVDSDLGGAVIAFHQCPGCGAIVQRDETGR